MKPFFLPLALGVALLCLNAQAQIALSNDVQQQMIEQIQNMPPAERQAMLDGIMKNAEAMQTCVNEAGGEAALRELQTISDAHHKQVKHLCDSGQRKKAHAYAQDASQELLKDPRVGKLRNCSRMALQNMPQLSELIERGGFDTSKHVCD